MQQQCRMFCVFLRKLMRLIFPGFDEIGRFPFWSMGVLLLLFKLFLVFFSFLFVFLLPFLILSALALLLPSLFPPLSLALARTTRRPCRLFDIPTGPASATYTTKSTINGSIIFVFSILGRCDRSHWFSNRRALLWGLGYWLDPV